MCRTSLCQRVLEKEVEKGNFRIHTRGLKWNWTMSCGTTGGRFFHLTPSVAFFCLKMAECWNCATLALLASWNTHSPTQWALRGTWRLKSSEVGSLILSSFFCTFFISPLSIFFSCRSFHFHTHTHTHNKYGGGCGYIIQGYHGCDSVRCASLVVVTSTAYTLITLPMLSALTLNQPRTHKCVQSLHESLWGYNTMR